MKIAEVSQKYQISADTLRYYERVGLLPRVQRNRSGIRDYSEADLQRIEFVKCMRSAGLSIESLIHYFALLDAGDATLLERRNLLISEKDKLEARIQKMQDTLDHLNKKIALYDQKMKP